MTNLGKEGIYKAIVFVCRFKNDKKYNFEHQSSISKNIRGVEI